MENNYKEYLESFAWKAIKQVKLSEQPECECCGETATTVHHLSYERRGSEKEDDIVSICERCHNECHFVNGYQIKNDEETLRKRFEEVREIFGVFLKYGFELKGDNVFYNKKIIEGLDGKSFKVISFFIDGGYIKDKNGVYYFGGYKPSDKLIIDGDFSTEINDRLKTSHHCYRNGEIFSIDDIYNPIFLDDKKIFIKNNKYFYYKEEESGKYLIIEGVDLESIKIINNNYLLDVNNVYIKKCGYRMYKYIISEIDSSTFELINDKICKDKNGFYYNGEKVGNGNIEKLNNYYFKDEENIYYLSFSLKKITNVDYSSFKILNEDYYGIDKYNVYYSGNILHNLDVQSFHVFDNNYMYKLSRLCSKFS